MLRLSQNLSLQQRLAPQLIQSLRLLQMSTLQLDLEIKQQLEVNPLLEENLEQDDGLEEEEQSAEAEDGLEAEEDLPQEADEVDWSALLEDQFEQNDYNSERTEYDPDWELDRDRQENRITAIPPLYESLQEQLSLTDLAETERLIGEFIIGNIDEKGYLGCGVEIMAEALGIGVEPVERVLKVIQSFEPTGVGARGLQDCLLIQLAQQEASPEGNLAQRVIRDHWEDFERRRYTRVIKDLGIDEEELKQVLALIGTLQPVPGSVSSSDYNSLLTLDTEVPYITPDLIIEKVGEEWLVYLSDDTLPSLHINPAYDNLMKKKQGNGKENLRNFLSKNLNDARWLMNAIEQRRTTMRKVAHHILEAQKPFFEHGPYHLKPMVLQDVADAVEMHVSTISRVSNGKYMQTPHGVYELKYFFDSRVGTESGEDVSARSVKERIGAIVGEENKSKPLSDQAIADKLAEEGLKIARRTVAKYREQLGINPQRYRREL